MSNISVGFQIDQLNLESIHAEPVKVPHESYLTHLQFRRFAGCPMCNLHIQSFIKNYPALKEMGIREVVVFHSTRASMLSHHAEAPFPLIADPEKTLYKKFGVEASFTALLHPKAWLAGIKGLFVRGAGLPDFGESVIGLPADFLIDHTGKVVALKYGTHAYDHWEVDEVLHMVGNQSFMPGV